MDRYVTERIRRDLPRKIVFLTGPRQVGTTVLARSLITPQAATTARYFKSGRRLSGRLLQSDPSAPDQCPRMARIRTEGR